MLDEAKISLADALRLAPDDKAVKLEQRKLAQAFKAHREKERACFSKAFAPAAPQRGPGSARKRRRAQAGRRDGRRRDNDCYPLAANATPLGGAAPVWPRSPEARHVPSISFSPPFFEYCR